MTDSKKRARITIEFAAYWMSGFGGGRGRHLDASCLREAAGFPAMPLTQIKGTLRESAERLADENIGGWTPGLVDALFGPRTEDENDYGFAALAFNGTARMSPADKALFQAGPKKLYRRIAATSVNDQGVAKDQTLRFIEAAVPVSIHGLIEWHSTKEPDIDWVSLIDIAAANSLAFGKGKNDGYGRAIASIIGVEAASGHDNTPELDPGLIKSKEVRLVLRQKRPAIFSERAATEGAHRTLRAPTGAALLGWCAANGAYGDFGTSAFKVFHTGDIRFGNAAPIGENGEVQVPFPRNLFAPKGSKVDDENRKLNSQVVRVGPPPPGTDDGTQFEVAKGEYYRISTKQAPKLKPGQRLRTATREGRAARSQLFGYQHIDESELPLFAAPLARSANIDDADWTRILETFHGQTLRIGRAKSTGYGGEYECRVVAANLKPAYKSATISDRIVILALSDIALSDAFGQPVAMPAAWQLGMSGDWTLDTRNSAISLRRYAPWNGQLRSRDVEHQVIEAGSVLVFRLDAGGNSGNNSNGLSIVGTLREVGCGRIWVNPAFLMGTKLAACDAPELVEMPKYDPAESADYWPTTASTGLADWVSGSVQERSDTDEDAPEPPVLASSPEAKSNIHLLRLTLCAQSPVSLGSGDTIPRQVKRKIKGSKETELVDAPINAIQRDANGLPTIPGSSPQGDARHICTEDCGANAANDIFGVEYQDGTGQAGDVAFSWAQVCGTGGGSVSGLKAVDPESDALLDLLAGDTPLLRDHVALNAGHSVDERRKYARAAVPAGTCFAFELVAIGGNDARDKLIEAARLFRHPRFRLGGRTRRGYGRISVEQATCQSFSGADADELRKIRRQAFSEPLAENLLSESGFDAPDSDTTEFEITLTFRDSLRVGGTEAPVESVPGRNSIDNILWALREIRIDTASGNINTVFPLNATAFTGPLAHRMEFYARKGNSVAINLEEFRNMTCEERAARLESLSARPEILHEFLGVAKERSTRAEVGRASRMWVEDSVIEDVSNQITGQHKTLVDHVSIDRFTGGASDLTGKLFAEEWLERPTATIVLGIQAPGGPGTPDGIGGWDKAVADAFLKALRDICTARIPIGAKSLGACTGKIKVTGNRHEEWREAALAAGLEETP